jgi:hypothetical protein
MRRTVLALAGALAAVSLVACSSEQAAENMVNDALGGSASVDMGEDGEVRVDTSDGSYEIGTGEFPDGWPADLQLIPGFEILGAATNPEGLTVQMYAQGDQTAPVDAYVKDLQANRGWAVDPSIPPGTPNMWALTKEGKVVTIFSGPSGNETVVVMTVIDR